MANPQPEFHIDLGHVDLGHVDLGHVDLGHVDLGHFDLGHFDLGHFDLGHVDLGHFDLGHFDLGHFDLGHFDIGHFDFHFDVPFDDVPFDDVPFDDGGGDGGLLQAGGGRASTAALVTQHFNRLAQVVAQQEGNAVARHQQLAQGMDQTLQRLNASFGHLATAMSQALVDLQGRLNGLESRVADVEEKKKA